MKKQFIFLFLISTIALTIKTTSRLYLQSNYRKPITYKLNNVEMPIQTNTRIPLGDINSITSLLIKTTTPGALYKNITDKVTQLKNLSLSHPEHNAILIILDSQNIFEWKFAVQWEPTAQLRNQNNIEKIATFFRLSKNWDELYTHIIKNQILGQKTAQQVSKIKNTDYTQSTQYGKANIFYDLNIAINKAYPLITDPNTSTNTKEQAITGLQQIINQLYAMLERYQQLNLI